MASLNNPVPLTRHNFTTWKKQVIRLFEVEGLSLWLNAVDHPKTDTATSMELFRIKQSQSRAAGLLKSFCSPDIELEITSFTNPAEIWDYLNKTFQQPSRSFKSYCLTEFAQLAKRVDEELPTFIARIEECVRKAKDAGEVIGDESLCYKLLQFLDETYDFISRKYEECDPSTFNFKNIKTEVIKEYNRKSLKEVIKPECLIVQESEIDKSTFKRGRRIRCTKCGRSGHLDEYCRTRLNDAINNQSFIAEYVSSCNIKKDNPQLVNWWTLDTAATHHVCQNAKFFVKLENTNSDSVLQIGNVKHKIEGKGTVKFIIKEGIKYHYMCLRNVFYVPTLHKNLLSLSQMDKDDFCIRINKGIKVYSRNGRFLWSAKMRNNLYEINGILIRKEKGKLNGKVQETKPSKLMESLLSKDKNDSEYKIELNDVLKEHLRDRQECDIYTSPEVFKSKTRKEHKGLVKKEEMNKLKEETERVEHFVQRYVK